MTVETPEVRSNKRKQKMAAMVAMTAMAAMAASSAFKFQKEKVYILAEMLKI